MKERIDHRRRCLWAKGTFFVLDAEVGIIFLLLLLSLEKSNGEWNREVFCKKQGGILFLNLNSCVPYCIYVSLYLCLSMKLESFKTRFISLFLMPKRLLFCLFLCFFLRVPHPLSISSPLSFSASFSVSSSPLSISISMYILFLPLFFVIYNERILNDVVALPNNIIYHFLTHKWQNFEWSFFLHGNTSLIIGKDFCYYL